MKKSKIIKINVDSKVCELAKNIINKCLFKGYKINLEKVQQILVLIQGYALSVYDAPFFRERIFANKRGVRIKKVSTDFAEFEGGFDCEIEEYVLLLDLEERIVDAVIKNYGRKDVEYLNENTPIKDIINYAVTNKTRDIPCDVIKQIFKDIQKSATL